MKIKLSKSQKVVANKHTMREHNMTRRDFMGLGLTTYAGMMLLPSFIPSKVFA